MKVSDLRKKVSDYVSKRRDNPYLQSFPAVSNYDTYLTTPKSQPILTAASPIDMLGDYSTLTSGPVTPPVNPLLQLPASVASMSESSLIGSPIQVRPPHHPLPCLKPMSTFSPNPQIAALNADLNALSYETNIKKLNDDQFINDLRGRLNYLQNQNRSLLSAGDSNDQRIQLQLIASQMQLQDQALQIQLMLDDYAEKIKQQNAFLLNYQQELNYIKSRLTDLDYIMHVIEHTDGLLSC